MLRAILELCRISNLPTVWTNVLAAWLLASGSLDLGQGKPLAWLLLGASLLYSAGMMLNDAADAAWDRQHRPERPIPSGRISAALVWALVFAGLIGGYAIMVQLGGSSASVSAWLVAAIVGYDLYHKPWPGSVVIMGACRTLLYLAVGSALPAGCKGNPVLLVQAILLGLYIVGLTIAARSEAVPNAPAWQKSLARALLASPLLLPAWLSLNHAGWQGWLIAPLFIGLLVHALRTLQRGGPAIGQAVGLLLAGIPIVDALGVAYHSLPLALAFVATAPVLRHWQRWVAAT